MLSVLIPTYQWNCFPLVESIYQQTSKENIPFEIIVLDDASGCNDIHLNEKINSLSHCSFEILPHNLGRSAIRNLLASRAKYNWLLFLDADVTPCKGDFIKNYLLQLKKLNTDIIIGGIKYKASTHKTLRQSFGEQREAIDAEKRNKEPFRYFFTANFLIKKEIFKSVSFDENIKEYGYEDLLFSIDTKNESFDIEHINNPVYHLGIDNDNVFMDKTKQSLENLKNIIINKESNFEEIKLVKVVNKFRFFGNTISQFNSFFEKMALKKQSLFFFDLFKLSYLFKIIKESK